MNVGGFHAWKPVHQSRTENKWIWKLCGSGEWKHMWVKVHMCMCQKALVCADCVEACRCVFLTLACEAVNMEVCVLDTHNLPMTNFPATLTHDGRIPTAGDWRAAVVVFSIKIWLVLNSWETRSGQERKWRWEERTGSKTCHLLSFGDISLTSNVTKKSRTHFEKIKDLRRVLSASCLVTEIWHRLQCIMNVKKAYSGFSSIWCRNKSGED